MYPPGSKALAFVAALPALPALPALLALLALPALLALLASVAGALPITDSSARDGGQPLDLPAIGREGWRPPGSEAFRRAVHLLEYGSEGDRDAIAAELAAAGRELHPVERDFLNGRLAFERGQLERAADLLEPAARDARFRAEHVEVDYYLGMARHRLGDPAGVDCLRSYLEAARVDADPGLAETARSALLASSEAEPGSNIVWGGLPSVDAAPPGSGSSGNGTLRSRSGEASLYDLPGEILLLHFWASWCGPCTQELPDFVGFTRSSDFAALRKRGLVPVLITADSFLGEGEDFLRSLGLTTGPPALYHDPEARLLVSLRGERDLPATVAVARRERRVLAEVSGSMDWSSADTRDWLSALVDELRADKGGDR